MSIGSNSEYAMSALEDSLRKVYKLPQAKPRLMDGSPLPEGMVPGLTRTLEYRDANQMV